MRYQLRGVMHAYGVLTEVHIMAPSERTRQRCAFVSFETHANAMAATALNNAFQMRQTERPIVVRFADSQGKRQRTY